MIFHSVEKERDFEKRHILKLKDYYLAADVLEKVNTDDGYREKVNFIEQYLNGEEGWILDIGSNTCGEAEYLATKGFSIICTDINEYALDISKTRSLNFGRNHLNYVACDGHRLPFKDASVHFVTFIESLHHMDDPQATLTEVARVLAPSGKVLLYEPYAYNPYRRLAEIRDYFQGTIEKSFGITQLNSMLKKAGLRSLQVERHVGKPSLKKLERLSPVRRFLRKLYYDVSDKLPSVFGMVALLAEKPSSDVTEVTPKRPLPEILQCPLTAASMEEKADGIISQASNGQRFLFPVLNGIPVLIGNDAKLLTPEENNSPAVL